MEEKQDISIASTTNDLQSEPSLPWKSKLPIPDTEMSPSPPRNIPFNYLTGWRVHVCRGALYLSLFLANFEVSILSTSLVTITNDLGGFDKSNWIVTTYLIAYTVFILIWAKLSEVFNQRIVQCLALIMFIVFSAACGAATTMTQLIIFRSFQGIGGGGLYSVPTIMCFELTPPEQRAKHMGVLSAVFAMSYVLGPLIGGAICSTTTWRWVFLLNVPAGLISLILLLIAMPADFPYQGDHPLNPWKNMRFISLEPLRKLDVPGMFLLILASALLLIAVDEAGSVHYTWSSPLVVTFLVLSVILWALFFGWECYVSRTETREQLPVLPFQLLRSRIFMSMLCNSFTVGAVYTISVVQIPQRVQTLNKLSPLQAGYRLLPLVLSSPAGSLFTSIVAKKKLVPLIFILLFAATLQIVGSVLISTLRIEISINPAQYGYEIILGIGLGMSISALFLTVPENVESKYQAIALGALTQWRSFGGAIGLAAVTSVMFTSLNAKLSHDLTSEQRYSILQSATAIDGLPVMMQQSTRAQFGDSYNEQMRIVVGLAVAQFLATFFMFKKLDISQP